MATFTFIRKQMADNVAADNTIMADESDSKNAIVASLALHYVKNWHHCLFLFQCEGKPVSEGIWSMFFI